MAWILVLVGALLRSHVFFQDLPLRIDEARLGLNVLERSLAGLARPLDHEQGAPLGYLWLVKAATRAFGEGERGLRLVSFLAGVGTLAGFVLAARRALSATAGLSGLALLAVASELVAWSGDVKQYSTDACATAAILTAAAPLLRPDAPRRRCATLAVVGALAVALSHASVFVLAGVGGALVASALARRDRPRAVALSASSGVWLVVFTALYLGSYRHLTADEGMLGYWSAHFMPAPTSAAIWPWILDAWRELCAATRLESATLAAVLAGLGCVALARSSLPVLAFAVVPLTLAVLASALRQYPFGGRMLTFAVPLLAVAIGSGVGSIFELLRRAWRPAAPLALVPLLFVLVPGARRSAAPPRWTGGRADLPALLEHLAREREPGDALVLEGGLAFPGRYYAPRIVPGLELIDGLLGGAGEIQGAALERLRGRRRVWLLMQNEVTFPGRTRADYRAAVSAALDARGSKAATLSVTGLTGYLYELTP